MECDFCKSVNLNTVYDVPTSLIGAQIKECTDCGLVQSVYKQISNKHKHKSISCGADWGNVRHGKKIRLNDSVIILKQNKILLEKLNILDIGSNRGHFTNYILTNFKSKITAIEPDKNILQEYKHSKRLKLLNTRFEDVNITEKYDLVYCCHTLEHAASASSMLQKIRSCMKNNSYLYIDVPSIQVLSKNDTVEEFFIDKHTFHFSKEVLVNYLKYLGFDINWANDDTYNITILARKQNKSIDKNIQNYIKTKKYNIKKLKKIGKYINTVSNKEKICLYGATKIYDALVKYGNLNTQKITYIVDDFLQGYITQVHGKELTPSNFITSNNTNIVFLLTRSATLPLLKKLEEKNIKNVITFEKLLDMV